MLVWERGVGRTLACGTGACAVVVAGVLTQRLDTTCRVSLEGGDLVIEWKRGEKGCSGSVVMTGAAVEVYSGCLASGGSVFAPLIKGTSRISPIDSVDDSQHELIIIK